ncbi:putative dynamin family protein [Colletotrichum sublineola]|uniref:Putative dynamin family protein n=1 Tax=Colletotrichum sublineola TaxID=1173701 RepID=A0A066XSU5_COLSU|nr:putative dynamin family protein [Colletotrichum sublineola]
MSPESDDQHYSLTSPDRLRKIDQLPVGDQSSGKSSLLESLTGIPFPRGQELCTRYATQITHCREAQHRIDIAIIPGPHASKDHKRELQLYRRQVQTTAQLRAEFPDILAQANALMGIKTDSNTAGENTFSEDILKIEKCGPNEDYLTIIDVPGIFRTTTEGVTTNKDKRLVKDMVKRLAVVNLVEGNRKPLKLGYYVVTNRGGDDHGEEGNAFAALQEREAIFLEQPWNNLPEDRFDTPRANDTPST